MSRRADQLRSELVAALQRNAAIRSDAVAAAFLRVPRERFVPSELASGGLAAVYADDAIALKHDRSGALVSSASQPTMIALMLELLAPRPGDRVLEIGTGSGYNAALLCELTAPDGAVTTVELEPELARHADSALRECGYRAVTVVIADGHEGYPRAAPYDRLIVTAASSSISERWTEQLRDGGRLVVPLRARFGPQLIPAFERRGARLEIVGHTSGTFVPLRDKPR